MRSPWLWSRIEAVSREPVLMTSGEHERNRVTTLICITGTALRGAIAARALRLRGVARPGQKSERLNGGQRRTFLQVFESGQVRFPFLWIADPVVLSSQECKTDRSHPLVDMFGDGAAEAQRCRECGGDLDRSWPQTADLVTVRTRTAISDEGTAQTGMLYAQEELTEGLTFRGWLRLHEDAQAGFAEWVGDWGEQLELVVGADRSTSGAVSVCIGQPEPSPWPPLDERSAGDGDIRITALSPVILVDRWLRPVAAFEDDALGAALGVPVHVRQGRVACRTRRVVGWNQAAGLPKPGETALVEGSTALIAAPAGDDEGWRARLAEIEARGIGLRRAEGFGDVVFGPPPTRPAHPELIRPEASADAALHLRRALGDTSAAHALELIHAERIFRAALQVRSVADLDGVLDWAAGRPWALHEGVGRLRRVWAEARKTDADVALRAFRLWLEDAVRELRARETGGGGRNGR